MEKNCFSCFFIFFNEPAVGDTLICRTKETPPIYLSLKKYKYNNTKKKLSFA
jgi:hypothetical protein